jgi:hypothetical protein
MYFRQMVRNYTAQVKSMRRGAKENIEAAQLSKLRNAKFEVRFCIIYDCSCQLTLTVGQTCRTLLKLPALSLFLFQLSLVLVAFHSVLNIFFPTTICDKRLNHHRPLKNTVSTRAVITYTQLGFRACGYNKISSITHYSCPLHLTSAGCVFASVPAITNEEPITRPLGLIDC